MTLDDFIAQCQARQAAYIASERDRYAKARMLCAGYAREMSAIGLHPLTRMEIADRFSELDRMERDIPETYGDTPAMRGAWELHGADAPTVRS